MAIADQLAELNTLRENLATAINGNGVDASTAEGLSSLVQKAGQVAEMYKGMIDASITEVYYTAETVRNHAFYSCAALTSVDLPVATSIGSSAFYSCAALTSVNLPVAASIGDHAFYNCDALTSVNLPVATSISDYAFYGCDALTSVNLPVATSIGSSAFRSCTALTSVNLPVATSIGSSAFRSCAALTSVDLPVATSIGSYAFNSCTALDTLILRKSDTICTLSSTNALANTPIASGTGYIYVPAALVDSYKAANNWSTYANQIRAIEDYPEICGGAV